MSFSVCEFFFSMCCQWSVKLNEISSKRRFQDGRIDNDITHQTIRLVVQLIIKKKDCKYLWLIHAEMALPLKILLE